MPLGLVRVGSTEKNPSHDIELWDGIRAIGLKLDGGPRGVQEIPQTPSTLKFSGGGTKFGDWEPGMSHIQQSSWQGGFGQEQFSDDDTRYFDSQGCFTLIPNKLVQGGMWFPPNAGTVLQRSVLPGSFSTQMNVVWKPLLGTLRYRAHASSHASTITADKCYIWIRRVGSPGTLTVEIRTDNAGDPSGTVLQTVTKTISDVTDTLAVFLKFDWTGTESLTGGTTYHIVIYGASADSAANHWEVACGDGSASSARISSDGSTWTNPGTNAPFYTITPADISRKWIYFELDGALYKVSAPDAGGAPNLYLNGFRGKATSATSTTLVDTNTTFNGLIPSATGTSWLSTQTSIKIINGTGVGQVRRCYNNSADNNTLQISPAWDITPDSTSEYVVIGFQGWTEITGHGLTKPVTSVCVSSYLPGVAYFAQGSGTTMRRMRFDATASPPAHEFAADGTNQADLLYTFYDQSSKTVQIWRALNGTTVAISRAPSQAWGTSLTFGTAIPVGTKQFAITNLIDHDGLLRVLKEDSLWTVTNDTPVRENIGLGASPSPFNGKAAASLGLFLYFNFMNAVERWYERTLDHLDPFKAAGFASKVGPVSAMTTAFNWLFVAVDAGASGTSSVLLYDGQSWHPIFTAWETGKRIRNLYWQAIPGAWPRLWIDVGGDVTFVPFPQDTLNPLNDADFPFFHEGVMIGSTIDMDAFDLPKFIKERTAVSQNLSAGTEIRTDYQTDSDIGTSTWTSLGTYYQSPVDVVSAGFGNIRQVRFRDRLITDSATTPTIVKATIMEGYARTPLKYQYNMRVKISSFLVNYLGARDAEPREVVRFLKNAARGARKIIMRSRYEEFDNLVVIVEPPSILREFVNSILGFWGGTMTVTVREA